MSGACPWCGNAHPECSCRINAVQAIVNVLQGARARDRKRFEGGLAAQRKLSGRFSLEQWAAIHEDSCNGCAIPLQAILSPHDNEKD